MQIGDAVIGIDHRQPRPCLVNGSQVSFDSLALCVRQIGDLRVDVADAIIRVHTERVEKVSVFLEDVLVIDLYGMAEHDRVGHLHHGRFQMQRQQQVLLFGCLDLRLEEGS